MTRERPRFQGVLWIVRFNWPFYVAAIAVNLVVLVAVRGVPRPLGGLAVVAASLSDLWLVASLVVSHYVYDRSAVARCEWLGGPAAETVRTVATFHAGHDEASVATRRHYPDVGLSVFDFFDPTRNTEASLLRARRLAKGDGGVPMALDAIPLDSATLDVGYVVFAAHEIRAPADRVTFFRELARVLAPTGQLIVVEHLRDGWNALAYGPGALHFLSRHTWLATFRESTLVVQRESRLTPFVGVFELGRAP
jgi:hypothetical protein